MPGNSSNVIILPQPNLQGVPQCHCLGGVAGYNNLVSQVVCAFQSGVAVAQSLMGQSLVAA
jgi:hypothetical protein